VTGAVVGTFIVTGAFEGLRSLEGALNGAKIFNEQVIGLTEVVLAIAMIAVLILRPGGLFPSREIGAIIVRALAKRERST
jgi:branched-chain amino acid transport system permease protein